MQLSPHFTLAEFERSDTAVRHFISNSAPPRVIARLQVLCTTILEPLRERLGPIQISSGYRSPEVNRRVGSSPGSQHVHGEAVDIVVAGRRPLEVCEIVVEMGLPFHQLIHEFGSWTHVSIAPEGKAARGQCLTIDKHGTVEGLLDVRR